MPPPPIVQAHAAEEFLRGRSLTPEMCAQAAEMALVAVSPIDDVRGSAGYRREAAREIVARALEAATGVDADRVAA